MDRRILESCFGGTRRAHMDGSRFFGGREIVLGRKSSNVDRGYEGRKVGEACPLSCRRRCHCDQRAPDSLFLGCPRIEDGKDWEE